MRILIVDDNQDDRADLRRMLLVGSEERYRFIEAELGRTALQLLRDASGEMPDCILLDYYLPDMEAEEILAELLGPDGAMACPVVVLTGTAEHALGPLMLRAGAQDYISKDWLSAPALARAVRNAIERWTMAREIMQQGRELRMIADNTPDILARFDSGFRHIFVNTAAELATGRPASYFIGKTQRELGMPDALYVPWENAISAVFASGQPQVIEFSHEGASGRSDYASRLVPEFGERSTVDYVLSVTHDITEQRNTQTIVKASAERLQLALAAARSGVWEMDISSGTIDWSPENFLLYGRDPALGRPSYADWLQMMHPLDMSETELAVRKALGGETPDFRHEFRIIHPHGGIRWLLALGKVDFNAAGMPLRLSGINLDVTERKQMEKALLDEDQRKDEFLATLAHELRNPLAAMSAGLDLLNLSLHDPALAGRTRDMMQRQFGHMVRLVDDLLDISRVGSGKIELRRESLTVQNIVAHAVEGSNALIQALGHQFDISMPDQPVWVHGDLTRLAQVLANLLNNAAKYTASGGRIALTVHVEGQQVAISIADNGAGIPVDMQARIFDLFAQVDNTLSQSHGGLGIGLSLARKLIDMHAGSITCESGGLGKGSTFTARLPLALPKETATAAATATPDVALPDLPAKAHATAAVSGGPAQRVLIVDDNEDAAEALAMMLRYSGFETITAFGGNEGLAASRTFQPGVIFLDLGLPGMNGYEVARQIRSDAHARDAFLIALTGWGSDEDRRLSSEAGFDLHLTKPVDMQALTTLLRDHARTEACPG